MQLAVVSLVKFNTWHAYCVKIKSQWLHVHDVAMTEAGVHHAIRIKIPMLSQFDESPIHITVYTVHVDTSTVNPTLGSGIAISSWYGDGSWAQYPIPAQPTGSGLII